MELIKRERNIENYTIRYIPDKFVKTDSEGNEYLTIDDTNSFYFYGKIPEYKIDDDWNYIIKDGDKVVNTIDIDIFLTQKFDDMGIFTDMSYNPLTPYLTTPPSTMGPFNSFVYGRFPRAPLSFYLPGQINVLGDCDDSQLDQVKSYRVDLVTNQPIYQAGLDLAKDIHVTFDGVISTTNNSITYVLGADKNNIPNTGVHFVTFTEEYVNGVDEDGNTRRYRKTNFSTKLSGTDTNNVTLSALTKNEEYSGIVFPPEVKSEVFIDRGIADIFERHAMLSEIKSSSDIDDNRGGYLRT